MPRTGGGGDHRRWSRRCCVRPRRCCVRPRRRLLRGCTLTLLLVPALCAAAPLLATVMCATPEARARASGGRATACSVVVRRRLGKERGGRKVKRGTSGMRAAARERERREDGEGEARPPLLAPGPRSGRPPGSPSLLPREYLTPRAHLPFPASAATGRRLESCSSATLAVDGGARCRCATTAPGEDRGIRPRATAARTDEHSPHLATWVVDFFIMAVFFSCTEVFLAKRPLSRHLLWTVTPRQAPSVIIIIK
ncbi:hypothetical protein VPH35_090626 [Triticum aestivum]